MKQLLKIRIPTLLGIFLLFIGLGATTFLTQNTAIFQSTAASDESPKDIRITNVTDTSLTISYTTTKPVPGRLSFGQTTQLGTVIFDDRDKTSNSATPHTVHYFTITALSPNTEYFFSILSGKTTFLQNNSPFKTKTAIKLTTRPAKPLTLSGTIKTNNDPLNEAIIYITSDTTQTFSTLVSSNNYSLTFQNVRNPSLASYTTIPPTSTLKILLLNANTASSILIRANQQIPLPLIILGKDYDFRYSISPLTTTASPSASLLSFPVLSDTTEVTEKAQIITPKEAENFTDAQPQFKGKTLPNQTITLTIHSEQVITASVKADSQGNWSFRPSTPLAPGKHTITTTSRNSNGILQTISRSFMVYAQGSQFVEPSVKPTKTTITPSPIKKAALPTPTKPPLPTKKPSPTPTKKLVAAVQLSPTPTKAVPTPTPTKKPTATPTKVPTPTRIPATPTPSPTKALTPTITPTPSRSPSLTPTPTITKLAAISPLSDQLPPTGTPSVIIGAILSLIAVGIGTFLTLLTRSSKPL